MDAEPGDPAAVKRTATKAIATAAATELTGLGLVRRGSGPRYRFDDRGWWRINVWFEPSGHGVKINLRVGRQYLWKMTPHESMDYSVGAENIAEFPTGALDGSVGPPADVAAAYAREAARRVRLLQTDLADDTHHLKTLATAHYQRQTYGSTVETFVLDVEHVLFANVLLGRADVCREIVGAHRNALLADPRRLEPSSRVAAEITHLNEIETIVDSPDARVLIAARINAGRELLKMAPMADLAAFGR